MKLRIRVMTIVQLAVTIDIDASGTYGAQLAGPELWCGLADPFAVA
jgi:hypothetical protein